MKCKATVQDRKTQEHKKTQEFTGDENTQTSQPGLTGFLWPSVSCKSYDMCSNEVSADSAPHPTLNHRLPMQSSSSSTVTRVHTGLNENKQIKKAKQEG